MKKFIAIFLFSFSCIFILAQNKASLYDATLFYTAEKFDKALPIIEALLQEKNNDLSDSEKIQLLRWKYSCIYNTIDYDDPSIKKGDYSKMTKALRNCTSTCWEAISLQKTISPLSEECIQMERDYCFLTQASSSHWHQCYGQKDPYYICISDILSTGKARYSDYEWYYNALLWQCDRQDEGFVRNFLNKEHKKVESYNDYRLINIFKSIKASIERPFNQLSTSIKEYENVRSEFTKASPLPSPIAKFAIRNLLELSDLYSESRMYASSASILKECISLNSKHWEALGCTTPWEDFRYAAAEMFLFTEYCDALIKTKEYSTIIDYSKSILKERPKYLAERHLNTIRSYRDYALKQIGEEPIQDYSIKGSFADVIINEFEKGNQESAIIKAKQFLSELTNLLEYNPDEEKIPSIVVSLLRNKQYEFVAHSLEQLFERTDKAILEEAEKNWGGYNNMALNHYSPFDEDDSTKKEYPKVSEHDAIIAYQRESWHYWNGVDTHWRLLEYLATAYWELGMYDDAVRIQTRCHDIVKTTWPLHGYDERNYFLKSAESEGFRLYFPVEIRESYYLGKYYTKIDKSRSYSIFKEMFELIKEMSKQNLKNGIEEHREQEIERNTDVLDGIKEYCLAIAAENCPIDVKKSFISLAFDISVYQKNILLNIEKYSTLGSSSLSTKAKIVKELNLKIERSLITGAQIDDELLRKSQLIKQEINESVDMDSVLSSVLVSIDDIKSTLGPNDYFIDFCTYYTRRLQKSVFANTNPYKLYSIKIKSIAAIIIKRGWDCPKVVEIGAFEDLFPDSDSPLYVSDITDINRLYNGQCGSKIWEPILKCAGIKNGESISFVASDYINMLAIENMPSPSGEPYNSVYNIHRLSSAGEIQNKAVHLSTSDNGILIGDIEYTNFPKLRTTREVIDNIQKQVSSNVTVLSGKGATLDNFEKKLSNGYSYLLFSGHGYNHIFDFANDLELKRYLGNEECYSQSLRSMRLSGVELACGDFISSQMFSLVDLSKTKLAFLSSCSTASGGYTSEGVYGVQRGLKKAGVQTIIAPLWDVDEKATSLIVTNFFKNIFAGKDAVNALKKAQEYVRNYESTEGNSGLQLNSKIYSDPFYWAGFIVID